MKPVIGIISRPNIDNDNDKIICILENTRRALIKKGAIPLLTIEEKEDLKRLVDMCDGLLIPGGYKWFEYDIFVYKYALEKNIPILGICLGMQMMCQVDQNDNSNMYENIIVKNETLLNHCKRENKYVHNINIIENTKLSEIFKEKEITVNSKHNYHATKTTNLTVSAYSEDGLIEAVEYSNKDFVIGVQWHPEGMLDYDLNANKLLDEFINKCRNRTHYNI